MTIELCDIYCHGLHASCKASNADVLCPCSSWFLAILALHLHV